MEFSQLARQLTVIWWWEMVWHRLLVSKNMHSPTNLRMGKVCFLMQHILSFTKLNEQNVFLGWNYAQRIMDHRYGHWPIKNLRLRIHFLMKILCYIGRWFTAFTVQPLSNMYRRIVDVSRPLQANFFLALSLCLSSEISLTY